jgi:hypothetical protein
VIIEGTHFAERCWRSSHYPRRSIVVIGASLSGLASLGAGTGLAVAAFIVAFVGSGRARLLAASTDPGRLGRLAYVFMHPIVIAGIIAVAAADDEVLARPEVVGDAATTWMILGGAALFPGHAPSGGGLANAVVADRGGHPDRAGGLVAPQVSSAWCLRAAIIVGAAVADRPYRKKVTSWPPASRECFLNAHARR